MKGLDVCAVFNFFIFYFKLVSTRVLHGGIKSSIGLYSLYYFPMALQSACDFFNSCFGGCYGLGGHLSGFHCTYLALFWAVVYLANFHQLAYHTHS